MRRFVIVVGLATLVAAPARANLVKCQQGIEKGGTKLQASILKAFTKCKDGYRKAVAASQPVSGPAATCQVGLDKVLNFSNPVSAISKTEAALLKLQTFTPPAQPTCTDADLGTLGHLSVALFDYRWRRIILLEALKQAYDTQASLVGDFTNIMQEMGGAGCALCAALAEPPCKTSVCTLGAGTGAETKVLGTPIAVPIVGATAIAGCQWQNVLPNEVALIGSPNLGLLPTTVPGFGTPVCNLGVRSEGIYSCAGSTAPSISYTACQDSDLTNNGGVDECETTPSPPSIQVCQPDPEAGTGGPCATFTPGAPAVGSAFILNTTRLRIQTSPGAGPDGQICSSDDTIGSTPPAAIPVTTGSVSASLIDYATVGGTVSEGPVSGVVGPSCSSTLVGVQTGLKLVGAFPSAVTAATPSPLGDTVTRVSLVCN